MNDLIFEVRRSLIELDSGLNGDMSITEQMELIMYTLAYGKVPNSATSTTSLHPGRRYVFCVLVETGHKYLNQGNRVYTQASKKLLPCVLACVFIMNTSVHARCEKRAWPWRPAHTMHQHSHHGTAERATERATVRAAEHANAGRERDERASQRAAGRAACRDVADLSVEGSVRPGLCSGRGWHDGQGDAGAPGAARAGG